MYEWQFKILCNEEKSHYFNFNTNFRINLCSVHNSWGVSENKLRGYQIAFPDSNIFYGQEKNSFFIEL